MTALAIPATRNRKPRGQGPARRDEILAAATRIFLEEGVAHATMRRIAAAVGVSPAALYVYFPDKEGILKAIAEAWFAELLEAVAQSQQRCGPMEEKFEACIRTYVEFGLSHPDGYRLTFLSPTASRLGRAACESIPAADHSFAILQQGIEAMMQAGLFRTGPSEVAAEAIWACMHGVVSLLIDQCDHLTTPQDQLIRAAVDIVMHGMKP